MNKLTVLEIKPAGAANAIYPVIVSDEKEVILIDCGYPGFFPLLKNAATAKDIDISKLTKIIITHHDYDHMGALAEFKKEFPHIKVLSSIEEEQYISGKKQSLRLQQALALFDTLPEDQKETAKNYQQALATVKNVEVDLCVKDKDSFDWGGGLEIVATPGHMPGHISVYIKDSKTLVTGDALTMENGNLAGPNPHYTLDMATAKDSIKKLLNYDIERIICYHGGVCTQNCRESLQKILL